MTVKSLYTIMRLEGKKHFIYILCLFLYSCDLNDEDPKVSLKLQGEKIQIYINHPNKNYTLYKIAFDNNDSDGKHYNLVLKDSSYIVDKVNVLSPPINLFIVSGSFQAESLENNTTIDIHLLNSNGKTLFYSIYFPITKDTLVTFGPEYEPFP